MCIHEFSMWRTVPDGISGGRMLTDIQLRRLNTQEKIYKITDRDGFYLAVSPTGTRSFPCR